MSARKVKWSVLEGVPSTQTMKHRSKLEDMLCRVMEEMSMERW